jgi:SAM-dependent methyltransferase
MTTAMAARRPWLLGASYRPTHEQNRMRNEGGVEHARALFYAGVNPNMRFLLDRRFLWMQRHIDPEHACGVELGCGQGYGKDVLRARSYLLTDYAEYPWLDVKMVDALATPFADGSFDFVIASNMIHHVPFPIRFCAEVRRILKPGGKLLVQDVNCSVLMRVMLHLMRIEGYSYDVDVFDGSVPVNDPDDLWSGNNAVPNMLFDDEARFHDRVPGMRIREQGFGEVLVYLASGGVTAKTFFIPLPGWALRMLGRIDDGLVALAPQLVALQRRAVIERVD